MSVSVNSNLKDKLAERAAVAPKAAGPADTIAAYLKRMEPEIKRALPKHMDPDRLTRIALTTIRTNPKLLKCSVQSLMAAVMTAAQLGLEPGLLGHCYIIPYSGEAQFQIGYKGLIDLARRSGNIESIAAHEVCENDEFEFEYGLNEKLRHKPALKDRGRVILFYAYAKFRDGGHQIEVMSIDEIEQIRKRSKAGNTGPWVTDYVEMGKKTVVKRLCKYLPISVEVMRGIAQDETIKREIKEDMTEVPDVTETIDVTAAEVQDEGVEGSEKTPPESAEQPQEVTVGQQSIFSEGK
ncbi:MAG: recombination protein RecT [Firmicutes bacterium]|nr:recombination protein RecT [Bacillota bacterium]